MFGALAIFFMVQLPPPPGDPQAVVVQDVALAASIGLDPESAACAALTAGQLQGALIAVAGADEVSDALTAADAGTDTLVADASALANLVQAGAGEDVHAQWQQALSAVDEANDGLAALRQQLFSVGTQQLSEVQASKLSTVRLSLDRTVPPWFRVLEKSAEEWVLVETALRGEARAERMGTDLAPELAELLVAVRTDPAVVEAKAAFEANVAILDAAVDALEVAGGNDTP